MKKKLGHKWENCSYIAMEKHEEDVCVCVFVCFNENSAGGWRNNDVTQLKIICLLLMALPA